MAPVIGAQAPDFTLASTAGDDFTLSSLRGQSNVLLAFFPLAFTGTCTAEMCEFTTDFSDFQGANAKVLGISVDSLPTLKEFQAKHAIGVDLLSDFKREVSRLYGTLIEDRFFSNRAYFVIDREGVLRWTYAEANPSEKRANAFLLEQLAALT